MYKLSQLEYDTNCWLFQGSEERGYGQIHFQGKTHKCHRISAMIFLELIDPLQANHKCNNRNCWNPDHLYVGTEEQNKADIIRTYKTYCKNGHELTENNIYLGRNNARNCRICTKERANNRYARNKERQ